MNHVISMFFAVAFFRPHNSLVYPPISQCTVACVFLWIPGYFLANYIDPNRRGGNFSPKRWFINKGILFPKCSETIEVQGLPGICLPYLPRIIGQRHQHGPPNNHCQVMNSNSWPNLIFIRWVGYLTIRNLWRGHLSKYSNRLQIIAGSFCVNVFFSWAWS